MKIRYLVALLSFFLLGCDDSDSSTDLTKEIETQQASWSSLLISDYTFFYQVTPTDCPTADALPGYEITVINGAVATAYVPEYGETVDVTYTSLPTIDEVFEQLLDSVDDLSVEPEYDEDFSFPTYYETDESDAECDGFSINVSNFM